jgi:3'-5' exoribonuclease 1
MISNSFIYKIKNINIFIENSFLKMKKRKDKIHSQTIWKNKLLYLKKFFFFHLTNHSKNKIENKNYYNHFSTKNSLYSNNKRIKSESLYDYICVVYFEATCEDSAIPLEPQEIIEFPVLLVNTRTNNIDFEFHRYVKPVVNPQLSQFCMNLTGITQEMVDKSNTIVEVMKEFDEWIDSHLIQKKKKFMWATFGNWDLTVCLPKNLKAHQIKVPYYFSEWLDLRLIMPNFYGAKQKCSFSKMLEQLGIERIGKTHSGIDDTRTTAKVVQKLINDGYELKPTNTDLVLLEELKKKYLN